MADDAAADEYARAMGSSAATRQTELASSLHKCCGEWKQGPHHEACRNFKPDEPPQVIEGQESLL